MPLQESLQVAITELEDIDEQINQAEKLTSIKGNPSILTIRDELERLKTDVQELSQLSGKTDDTLKDVQQLWHKIGTILTTNPGAFTTNLFSSLQQQIYPPSK